MKLTFPALVSLRRLAAAALICTFAVLTAGAARAQGVYGFATLYAFTDAGDGGIPYGGLVRAADGTLYGTAYYGGNNNAGTIFKIAPDGAFSTLHAFAALGQVEVNADGARPYAAPVIGPDGALYGTTSQGGAHGLGVVYRVTTVGTFTKLADFDQTYTGAHSHAPLIVGSDGDLYGTAYDEAFGFGTIFKITMAGQLTVIHELGTGDGANPEGPLCEGADGFFYGTTYDSGANNTGTVFQVTPTGGYTVIHTFGATTDNKNGDGANPYGGLVQGADGRLYGTTVAGGGNAQGVAFAVSTSGEFQTLVNFDAATSGSHPYGTLLTAGDGNFYGTTTAGGSGNGNIFRLTPAGVLTSVAALDFGTFGATPYGELIEGAGGVLYGTATAGGGNGFGTVFAVGPVPTVTLATTTPSVTNNGKAVGVFLLTLSEAQDHDVFVSYTVKGSGVNGTDYTFLKGKAKIKAGRTSKAIKVRPQGDLEGESKKTVKLALAAGDGYTVGTEKPVKVKILAP